MSIAWLKDHQTYVLKTLLGYKIHDAYDRVGVFLCFDTPTIQSILRARPRDTPSYAPTLHFSGRVYTLYFEFALDQYLEDQILNYLQHGTNPLVRLS